MQDGNPYAAPRAEVSEQSDVVRPGMLADRTERLLAAIVDTAVGLVVILPAIYFSGGWDALTASKDSGVDELVQGLGWVAIGLLVHLALHGYPLARYGQTWGKRVLGIRIADRNGGKPSLATLVLRRSLPIDLASCIPFAGQVVPLADILLIFRRDRRCGHDHLAGTWVVKTEANIAREARATELHESAMRNDASAAASSAGA